MKALVLFEGVFWLPPVLQGAGSYYSKIWSLIILNIARAAKKAAAPAAPKKVAKKAGSKKVRKTAKKGGKKGGKKGAKKAAKKAAAPKKWVIDH